MPPKRSNYKRSNQTIDHYMSDSKRTRMSKQENFRSMNDLQAVLPFSPHECLSWFHNYSEKDMEGQACVGPNGINSLCKDLSLNLEDLVMLGLAWKLNAQEMGFFTQQEWLKGMESMQCDNCEKLKVHLQTIRQQLEQPDQFRSFFAYTYDLAKVSNQRNLDITLAKELLKMLLTNKWVLLDHFISFLDTTKYRVFNKDQWSNILEFSRAIKPDFSNYDINGAWPVMLDEFVEYCQVIKDDIEADEL